MSAVDPHELAALEIFAGVADVNLAAVASRLVSRCAAPGEVLMRQGEPARAFVLIAEGSAEVCNGDAPSTAEVSAGMIVGEVALLRHAPRMATVTVTDYLRGFAGDEQALAAMLALPGVAANLLATARARLAGHVAAVPIQDRDDTELLLRPALPGDRERFAASLQLFSPQTLYRRFMSVRTVDETLLSYLFDVDYVDHFVWIVTDGPQVVATARYVRDRHDPALAEVAFIVADAYQGRGIGTLLLGALAAAARAGGIGRFHAYTLAHNRPVRTILDRVNAQSARSTPAVLTTTVDVPATCDISVGLTREQLRRIEAVARQVIHAFG